MKPVVSFIIPVYNREEFLRECLDSILTIKNISFEIILIDDASTDNSRVIIDEYLEKTDKIQAFFMEKNIGPGPCRNFGIKKAKGEFIGFIDSDDTINSYNFDSLFNMLDFNSDIAIFNHNLYYDNNTIKGVNTFSESKLYSKKDFLEKFPYSLTFPVWICLFKNEFINKHKLVFKDTLYLEDECFVSESLVKAKKIYTFNKDLYNYRYISTNSLVSTANINKKQRGINIYIDELLNINLEDNVEKKAVEYALFSLIVRNISELVGLNFFDNINLTNVDNSFRFELDEIKKKDNIKEFFYNTFLSELKRISETFSKKIYLCPASKYSIILSSILKKYGINVYGFLDNNENSPYCKQAKDLGYLVKSFNDIKYDEEFCIGIFHTSLACHDIIKQLKNMGFVYDKDFMCGLIID